MQAKIKLTILLIEDNPGDVTLLEAMLDEAAIRYELTVVGSLRDGLDELKTKPYELVLLDLSLPDSTGFKTLTTIMEKAPEVPVILITGFNNEIIGNQAVKAGAQDFLVKGQFDGKLLGRAIRYSMQRFSKTRSLARTAKEIDGARRWFLEVQEMAHLGTWEMDVVFSTMQWTDEVYRILGFKPGSLTPALSTYLEYVHPEDKAAVEAFFSNSANNTDLHHLDHRIIVDGVSIRYVALHAKLHLESVNSKIKIVGGIQDITASKLNEQLLLEKYMSSKTASIQEEALTKMSFNIRTPLSSVTSLLHLMEAPDMAPAQKSHFDNLKTSVGDLSLAVNNLLNFTLLLSDTMDIAEEEIVLKDFLKGIADVMHIKAEKASVQLNFIAEPSLPERIICDPRKINQILYNLLDNALKFTPQGGQVHVRISGKPEAGGKLALQLSVADTGPGIDPKTSALLGDVSKLSELPETNNRKPLGMAIVGKLLEVLHGEMKINSKAGSGSTFSVTIPVRAARGSRFLPGGIPDAPLSILLVEDHPINQITTSKVLTSWSPFVSVDLAVNGKAALEKLEQNRYDLILMDLQMPVMDGFEATETIRKSSNIPIIALTANASVPEQERCLSIGMSDYLTKPFKPDELYAKVLSALVLVMN